MSIDHASALVAATSETDISASWGGAARGAEFLTSTRRSARCRELAEDGYLVARVVTSDPVTNDGGRSPLRNALEGAVEISLALRGALAPTVELDAPVRASVEDQIHRLRKLGAPGLCIVLPELMDLTRAGRLGAADSAVLEAWRGVTADHPVVLLFDDADQDTTMLAPRTLDEVFDVVPTTPTSWPDDARSLLDQSPTSGVHVTAEVETGWDAQTTKPVSGSQAQPEQNAAEPKVASMPEVGDDAVIDDAVIDAVIDDEAVIEADESAARFAAAMATHDPMHEAPTRPGKRVIASDPLAGLDLDGTSSALVDEPIQQALFEASVSDAEAALPARKPSLSDSEVTRLCEELEAADGPKPVSVIQELFRTHYTPLLELLSAGFGDAGVERVVDDWRESFEKSYGEGFNTMRVTGRRPPMVLDAPEIATKIARTNGARAAQLLLVDGMRFDLGQRVQRELGHLLDGHAACVDQPVLWSALPTITPMQMHLLSRGPSALKEGPQSEREPMIQREGSLTTLRRVKIGQRDLVKLDLVEARLREAGPGFESRMSALAEEVADVIASYAEGLPPRTLLFIFGDHGFYMPSGGPDATGPAEQGNATPEEVLIGAQAWMID